MDYYRTKSLPIGYQGEVVCKAQSQTMGTEFITEMVMEAVTAAKNAGVTLYCGEFGVIDQAPVEDTLRWFTDVDTVFRQFGIGCAVWTYKEMDFGLIGEHYAPIREQIAEALEPEVNGNPNKLTSYYDLFRVENGKIAEHWDVMETIADKSTWQNQNGKF